MAAHLLWDSTRGSGCSRRLPPRRALRPEFAQEICLDNQKNKQINHLWVLRSFLELSLALKAIPVGIPKNLKENQEGRPRAPRAPSGLLYKALTDLPAHPWREPRDLQLECGALQVSLTLDISCPAFWKTSLLLLNRTRTQRPSCSGTCTWEASSDVLANSEERSTNRVCSGQRICSRSRSWSVTGNCWLWIACERRPYTK